jgi:hypothetical protein
VPDQYAAQVPVLQKAGLATVAFDYLGCGRSEKPNDFAAYAAEELYQDLLAVFQRYSKVRAFFFSHRWLLVNCCQDCRALLSINSLIPHKLAHLAQ